MPHFVNRTPLAVRLHRAEKGDWLILGFVALFALITFIYPIARSLYRFEIAYNECWNVYNALKGVQHIPLYGAKYAWTIVNCPALSFYVIAYLSRFTHDYLLTGRLLSLFSLALSCIFVGLIIRRMTRNIAAAFFGGFFCLALYCTEANRLRRHERTHRC